MASQIWRESFAIDAGKIDQRTDSHGQEPQDHAGPDQPLGHDLHFLAEEKPFPFPTEPDQLHAFIECVAHALLVFQDPLGRASLRRLLKEIISVLNHSVPIHSVLCGCVTRLSERAAHAAIIGGTLHHRTKPTCSKSFGAPVSWPSHSSPCQTQGAVLTPRAQETAAMAHTNFLAGSFSRSSSARMRTRDCARAARLRGISKCMMRLEPAFVRYRESFDATPCDRFLCLNMPIGIHMAPPSIADFIASKPRYRRDFTVEIGEPVTLEISSSCSSSWKRKAKTSR